MRKTVRIYLILLFAFNGYSQGVKKYIKENFIEITSINPKDNAFADLKAIGEAIGESQIVFLGEQDHGDTRTIQAKMRLVKYLHEELGFSVLAFESDFYALNISPPMNRFEHIHGIWRGCNEYDDLKHYLNNSLDSKNPIQVSGFDCRHHSNYSKQNLMKDFDSIIEGANIPFGKSINYFKFKKTLQHVLLNEYDSEIDTSDQFLLYKYLDTIQVQFQITDFNSKEFWIQEMNNLKQMVKNSLNYDINKSVFSNIRDSQMAENLLWLSNFRFKNQKIIVWAASFHIVKDIMKIENYQKYVNTFENEELVTMGDIFNKSFSGKTYYLGFTSYEGTFRYGQLKKPTKRSFESIAQAQGYDFGFINLKNVSTFKPFVMNGTCHVPYKSDWSKNFDGIFYIREMSSCYN
jgi:erythromycin esterase